MSEPHFVRTGFSPCDGTLHRPQPLNRKSSHGDDPDTALASIGIDIGKEAFHIVGFGTALLKRLGAEGSTILFIRHKLDGVLDVSDGITVMRAGRGWTYSFGRKIKRLALVDTFKKLPPCIVEKTQDQLDLKACHRVRSCLISRRTATINQIRAFLIEQGRLSGLGPGPCPTRFWRYRGTGRMRFPRGCNPSNPGAVGSSSSRHWSGHRVISLAKVWAAV